ncbi:MAG: hypothetical protein WC584_00925 [Candidatus Pacearchaeota archaeon]
MKIKNILKDEKILTIIIAVLVVLFAILLSFPNMTSPIKDIMSKEKIYSVDIIKINGCDDCFDLNRVLTVVKKDNSIEIKEIKDLDYKSKEAESLIKEYGIKTTPALIVKSRGIEKREFNKEIFSSGKNYLLFDKSVPYLDLSSGEIKGKVDFKEIQDSSCKECPSLSSLEKQLEALGIKKKNYEIIDSSQEEGKKLIKDNNIRFYNNLIIGKEIKAYWWIFPSLSKALTEEKDYYVFSEPIVYPYKDAITGMIKGKVEVIYVTANDCNDCSNVSVLKEDFEKSGVYIAKDKYIDYSSGEGKQITSNYNINAVPTIILSKEILDYPRLSETLKELGTFEKDDSFVFRELKKLNLKYKEI